MQIKVKTYNWRITFAKSRLWYFIKLRDDDEAQGNQEKIIQK